MLLILRRLLNLNLLIIIAFLWRHIQPLVELNLPLIKLLIWLLNFYTESSVCYWSSCLQANLHHLMFDQTFLTSRLLILLWWNRWWNFSSWSIPSMGLWISWLLRLSRILIWKLRACTKFFLSDNSLTSAWLSRLLKLGNQLTVWRLGRRVFFSATTCTAISWINFLNTWWVGLWFVICDRRTIHAHPELDLLLWKILGSFFPRLKRTGRLLFHWWVSRYCLLIYACTFVG